MGENIRDVIARMRTQQKDKTPVVEKPKEVEEEYEEDDEFVGDEEEEQVAKEEAEEVEKAKPKPKLPKMPTPSAEETSEKPTPEVQQITEIDVLQNNGRFRAEMLFQLQEMNRALVVIAGVLVDKFKEK